MLVILLILFDVVETIDLTPTNLCFHSFSFSLVGHNSHLCPPLLPLPRPRLLFSSISSLHGDKLAG